MIKIGKFEEQILKEFYSILKVRVNTDPSFMELSTVKMLIREMKANLKHKPTLFNMIQLTERYGLTDDKEQFDGLESLFVPPIEIEEKDLAKLNKECEKNSSFKDCSMEQDPPLQNIQLSKEEIMEMKIDQKGKLTQKTRHVSAQNTNLHITGLMNMKGRRYVPTQSQQRVPLAPALIKTPQQQFMLVKLNCHLNEGLKDVMVSLAQKLAKKQELVPKVANAKELLISELMKV